MALSRRELLKRGAVGGAAFALGPAAIGCRGEADSAEPRIVIVGAGLAGLSCAFRLQQRGLASTVYEANPDRIGGRCWTAREFADGQTAEHGGEFIDTRHRRMRGLARRFGLELTDLYAVPNPRRPRLWLNAARRQPGRIPGAALFQRRIEAAARRVGRYGHVGATPAARAFDEMTVADWLDANLPGGSASLQGQWVWMEMMSEFGLDADRLSALNLLAEYVVSAPGADERFHVAGGNDQIPHALARSLPDGAIRPGAALQALYKRGNGSYGMRFSNVTGDVFADHVVLALPFTMLRQVDLSKAGLSRKRRACIDGLGMGTNAKVLMQFDHRPQRYGRWNGYAASDAPFLQNWESTLGEGGAGSVMTTFFGGRSGAGLAAREAHAPTLPVEQRRNLRSLGRGGAMGLPGLAAGFNGHAWTDHWASDPFVHGSYAAFLPGQYTRYHGYVGKSEGRIHFAGEHTATTNQGYLEGAVESGERAAEEVAAGRRR